MQTCWLWSKLKIFSDKSVYVYVPSVFSELIVFIKLRLSRPETTGNAAARSTVSVGPRAEENDLDPFR